MLLFLLKGNNLSMAHCDAVDVGRPSHHPSNKIGSLPLWLINFSEFITSKYVKKNFVFTIYDFTIGFIALDYHLRE